MERLRNWFARLKPSPDPYGDGSGRRWWIAGAGAAAILLFGFAVGWFWSREPDTFWVDETPPDRAAIVGYSTVDTLIETITWLLEKPGGYLSNDVAPPSVWLDNMPNFEFGVLVQCRDLARVLRNDYSRSQSQSTEDRDLAVAEPALNFSNDSWIFPTTESKYREALTALASYRERLLDENRADALFYSRADNLREWLSVVERRLGSLSQRLSASVSQPRVNIDLAGQPAAGESASRGENIDVRTPWLEIDDVFYEARGTAWALLHFMRAAQFDFDGVLRDKNAIVSLRQIIRELEGALEPVSSPIILNGRGYGLFANHSLVLASYLSRAHSAVIDLRELLAQG
ncbi:MAG: DUF2333 family protein [Gammaproteobacteria bacterium]|nr:DUF2333 family protein [Gammaproteobacteria bacterium]